MNITSKRKTSIIALSTLLGSFAFAGSAFAATPAGPMGYGHGGQFARPAVMGTVASVSGDTLTVTAKQWQRGATASASAPASTTYTVDATSATVTKDGASSSVASVALGDMVIVQGTVSGTTVTATAIRDGMMGRPGASAAMHKPQTPPIQGNGEPVVGGSVTAVNGTTLTVTAKSGTAYTVDVSAATLDKMGTTTALSNIAAGDNVVVQGTVNGTSVTAASVIDQGTAPSASGTGNGTKPAGRPGILGSIGGFFSHMFGFF